MSRVNPKKVDLLLPNTTQVMLPHKSGMPAECVWRRGAHARTEAPKSAGRAYSSTAAVRPESERPFSDSAIGSL